MIKNARTLLRQPVVNNKIVKQSKQVVALDGNSLNLEHLSLLGNGNGSVELSDYSWNKLAETRKIVDSISQKDEPVYGINTGFGRFSNVKIPAEKLRDLQYNLIRSHSTGVGKILPVEISRRIVALRINTLAKGFSGISPDVVKRLIQFFNSGCVPWIPQAGTVGASGDLVPLAHIGLSIIGEGLAYDPIKKKYEPSAQVLERYGLQKAELRAKDGLSLINGTQFICGVGSCAVEEALTIIKSIQAISALSVIALKGHPAAFDERVQLIRIHPGQNVVGEMMRELVPLGSNEENQYDVQDPYSLRCIPQVHGPSLEGIISTKEALEVEMNSGSDNPLVFTDREPMIVSGGNFHGEYPAKQLDILALYTHEIGSMSFMRAKRMMNPHKSLGMPGFLTLNGGKCSGLMTWENVAASLVSENKVLCHPSSVDSAETCADKEDHVSMGGFSARKAITISENVTKIIAVELMTNCHALQHRMREGDGSFKIAHPGLKKVYEHVSRISPMLEQVDRYTVPEYNKIHEYVQTGEMWNTVLQYHDEFVANYPSDVHNHNNQQKLHKY